MPSDPTVFIGMPVYNGEGEIEKAISKIKNQTYQNFRLFISNDASTDRTEEICSQQAQNDPRIEIKSHKKNQGLVWNYNYVLSQADTKYFMLHAHDDWLDEDYLEKCVQKFEDNHDLVLVSGGYSLHDYDGEFLKNGGAIRALEEDPIDRMRNTYQQFEKHNWRVSNLFGVRKTKGFQKIKHKKLGGDLLFILDAAFLGKIDSAKDTKFHNRKGGVGSNKEKLKHQYSLSDLQYKFRKEFIIVNLVKHLWKEKIYDQLNFISRILLISEFSLKYFYEYLFLRNLKRIKRKLTN